MMKQTVAQSLDDHAKLLELVRGKMIDQIVEAASLLIAALDRGHKILLCGNGGSAADSQHIAAELTGRYLKKDRRPLPAIALTTDTSALTAVSNDFGFEQVFARQVRALGIPGDILICISTSGNSKNIIEACLTAKELGMTTVSLTGGSGGKLREIADMSLAVPSEVTPLIQEMHIIIAHILCDLIDRHFAG